jgi:hypothetical protein
MDESEKQRVLAEARANIADKSYLQSARSLASDPLERWRQEADAIKAREEEAKAELRDEEERRTREAQQCSPAAWNQWFISQLHRHLADHPVLEGRFEGVAEAVGELISELRARADARDIIQDRQRDEIRALQLECAQLRTRVAELRTDQVLNAMPGSSALRSTVN